MPKKSLSETNRRDFLKHSALGAAGASLSGTSLLAQEQSFAPVAGTDTLKLALIGCGMRGNSALRLCLEHIQGVEVVALADVFADKTQRLLGKLEQLFAKQSQVTQETCFHGLGGYRQAIDLADAVILATPPGFRPEQFEYAIKQGKHCFIEKPVATDVPGLKRMQAASELADKKGLRVVCGLQERYRKSYQRAEEKFIQGGGLGELICSSTYWLTRRPWVRKRQPEQTEMEFQLRNWYYFNWLCGDHIAEQQVHNLDIANRFHQALPLRARAVSGLQQQDLGADYGQIWDHHVVEFEYPNGSVMTSFCRQIPKTWTGIQERFEGTKGSLRTAARRYQFKARGSEEQETYRGQDDPDPYRYEMEVWIEAIRENKPQNDTPIGIEASMTGLLGRDAGYSGQALSWEELWARGKQLIPDQCHLLTLEDTPPVMPNEQGLYPSPKPGETQVLEPNLNPT